LTNNSVVYNRPDIIKKEAVGMDYIDLGEIQEVGLKYIKTKKGIIKKDIFYIPKNLVDRFDGVHVWFRVTEYESLHFKKR
jgi:hypothetical protein